MTDTTQTQNMAVFCDFENVAIGVRDTNYSAFNIQKVLERLLLKGNIVVKKASKKKVSQPVESEEEKKKQQALDLVVATVEDLFQERGEMEKVWGSMVKQALKRCKPGFNERYHGFSTFSKLLEEAQARKLLKLEADEKSGGYMIKSVVQEG